MIDWEVNMIKLCQRNWIMIEDITEVDNSVIASAVIYDSESIMIENTIETTKPISKPLDFY